VKKIDFEVHFATQSWLEALERNPGYPRLARDLKSGNRRLYYQADAGEPLPDVLLEKLLDIDAGRIAAMDAAGVDVAVLSLTAPGVEQLEPAVATRLAREANDELARAIARHPGRLLGYAALCPKDIETAVAEMERAVKELGLKGWKTHSNYGDSYLDEKRYWPLLAKAEELDAPIYLHPTVPKIKEFWTYGLDLAGPSFGFGAETSLTMMRLIFSGAFDAFPKLKVVIGHYGEGLPFLLDRIDFASNFPHVSADTGAFVPLERKPSDYLRENMWVSTSCNYLPAAFLCSRDALGMDRIVFGSDYPYGQMGECMAFLAARKLSAADERKLYEANAARLGVIAKTAID
jgi:predicted TIM-barrel fold metal-dependent hydrolase